MIIRDAAETDVDAIAAIYGHHVLNGTASYDLEPPPADFHRDKVRSVQAAGWPFLVAEENGKVAGYAYATQMRPRAAYRFTAEDSIYVHPERMRLGVGRALLAGLLERCAGCGFRTIIAVIGGAEPASMAVHSTLGFREVGRLKAVGFKFGQWLDSVYMQRDLPARNSA
jgi:L-amino acid N-acyltransferase YncA